MHIHFSGVFDFGVLPAVGGHGELAIIPVRIQHDQVTGFVQAANIDIVAAITEQLLAATADAYNGFAACFQVGFQISNRLGSLAYDGEMPLDERRHLIHVGAICGPCAHQ